MSGDTAKRFSIPSRRHAPTLVIPLSAAILPAVLAVCALALTQVGAAPKPGADDAVKTADDFAGVYLDRYVPPAKNLSPTPGATRKGRALADYYLGLLKERDGDGPGAVGYYRKVLQRDPSSFELAGRAAQLAAQGGNTETGLAILQESLEKNKEEPGCYLLLSSYYATYIDDAGESPDAIRIARDAYAKFPEDYRVVRHLVIMLLGFDDRDAAEAVLEEALGRENKDPLHWYRLGRVAQNVWPIPEVTEGPPEKVNEIYEKALGLAGDNLRLIESIADFFFASNQYPRASEIYAELIDKGPDQVTPREKLGRIHALNGEFDLAIEVLTKLLESHPDLPNTQKLLARIYEEEKQDREKAAEHYQNALRLSMGEVQDYLHTSALMLSIPGRASDAVDLMERARFHFPDNGGVLRLLGIAYFFDEKYATAVKIFKETVNLAADPTAIFLDDELYYRYGAAHERLKHFDTAAELFRKGISLVPAEEPVRAARIYNYLGYMWLEQDMNLEEAGELIIKANELIPEDGAFVDSLGWLYFKQKKYDKALEALLRAKKLLGEDLLDAVVVDHIAQSYFHVGNYKEAIAYEERAAQLDSESEEYSKRLKYYRKTAANPPDSKDAPPKEESKPEKEPAASPGDK